MLLWLQHRQAAVASTGPLAWELPYAVGEALKRSNNNATIFLKFKQLKLFVLAKAWQIALFMGIEISRTVQRVIYQYPRGRQDVIRNTHKLFEVK